MATLKGPSFSGPRTGWTSSSLVPQANTLVNTPLPWLPSSVATTPSNLARYDLTPQELGMSAGRNAGGSRGAFTTPTPIESLLAAIFPGSAFGADPAPPNPNTQAPQGGAMLRAILGDIGLGATGAPSAGVGFAAPAMAAPSIPGAPAFLPGAISNVQSAGMPIPGGGGANIGNALAGVSAIAAEQRIQQAEMQQAQAQAQADWFKSQQKIQQDAAKRQQMQRQKRSSASGWSSTPTFY